MTLSAGNARSLPCHRCGARFALPSLQAIVHCPYCGERHQVEAEQVHELDAYSEGVDRQIAKADEQLKYVASWAATEQSIGWKATWLPIALFMTLPMLFMGGVSFALERGWLDSTQMGGVSVMMTVGINLMIFGWVGWSYIKRSRVRGAKTALGHSQVACPGCGAANPLRAGETLTTCTHCGGALVPGRTIIEFNLDAARNAARRASIERFRAERRGMMKLMNYSKSARFIPLISIAPIALGLAGGTVWLTWEMVDGTRPFQPLIFLGWGAMALCVLIVVIWRSIRRSRRETLDAAFFDLSVQLGAAAQRFDDIRGQVAWLDRYWPAEYKTNFIHGGPYMRGLSGHVHGYPVMIDLDPTDSDQWRKRRLHLFVAAVPGPAVDDASRHRANVLEKSAESEGFDVRTNDAGIWAKAERKVVAQMFDTPAALHAMLPELVRLTQIAAARGLVPAPPID